MKYKSKIYYFLISLSSISFENNAMLYLGASHGVNRTTDPKTLSLLKKYQQCQTFFGTSYQASGTYRRLGFEALSACNHLEPELILITNGKFNAIPASSNIYERLGKKGLVIDINEKELNRHPYGLRRFIMFHEASHITLRHYNENQDDRQTSQRVEYEADKNAAIKSRCVECCRCAVRSFLALDDTKTTIESFDATPEHDLFEKLRCAFARSLHLEDTHPCAMERALRIYRYTKTEKSLVNQLCPYHQLEKISVKLNRLIKQQMNQAHPSSNKELIKFLSTAPQLQNCCQQFIALEEKKRKEDAILENLLTPKAVSNKSKP